MLTFQDRQRRHVTLSEQTWTIHILARRPWMEYDLEVVRSTVNSPDLVCQDVDHAERECCYSFGRIENSPKEYMKVVVAYDDNGDGFIVTAYPTDKPKAGEHRIWP